MKDVEQITPFSYEEMFFRPAIAPKIILSTIMNLSNPLGIQSVPSNN